MIKTDVCLSNIKEYDREKIYEALKSHFNNLGLNKDFFFGKNVVIKPNLVSEKEPEVQATTNPYVIEAIVRILNEFDVTPTIAESPGGIYSIARIKNFYKICGLVDVLDGHKCILNEDVSYSRMSFENGKSIKSLDIITPIINADIIIDATKLKSHALTVMTGTVKNLFGCVPGILKFEQHSAHPSYESFSNMIVDLCSGLCEKKEVVAITDAIICMEGEGPTAGSPREIGALITSRNPFANDLLSSYIIGFYGDVYIVDEGIRRGYIPKDVQDLNVIGADYEQLKVDDFKKGEAVKNTSVKALNIFSKGKIGRMFMPRPYVTNKCVGCQTCIRNCPAKTIVFNKKTKKAKIITSKCIRCYCCQELCPYKAVIVKRNPIISRISR